MAQKFDVHFINPRVSPASIFYEIPLNISMLCVSLNENPDIGEIRVIDLDLEKEIIFEDIVDQITNPGIFCIPCYTFFCQETLRLCKIIKEKNAEFITILGGPHATLRYESLLGDKTVDFAVTGEADFSLSELLTAIAEGGDEIDIAGVAYRKKEGISYRPHGRIQSLDALGSQVEGFKYFNLEKINAELGFVPYISSRGCCYSCVFCSSSALWGHKIKFLSADQVIADIRHIKRLGFEYINFRDDFFTFNKTFLAKVMECLKDEGIVWGCETRVDFVDRETLSAMKNSGCELLRFGIESFNQDSIDIMRKNFKVSWAKEILRMCEDIGFAEIRPSMIIGLPNENRQDIERTFSVCAEYGRAKFRFWSLSCVEGTHLYDHREEFGITMLNDKRSTTLSSVETKHLSNADIIELLHTAHANFGYPLSVRHKDFSDIFGET